MFIPRVYYPHDMNEGALLSLDKETSHYLCTVLRLSDGDKVIFFNGQGGEYEATLFADKKRSQANILAFHPISRESPLELHLGQGLARPDRMDWVIQKATELGVKSITPLISANCGVKLPSDRADKRILHWEKIAQSACEQSGRTVVPTIMAPMIVSAWSKQ
ncbi:MAG TPA: 16S rRNA (uracil(1498)-N(3))-methyltransferase, partial [Candidatus Berkiella sp.]|nr:16S rRNA (uracil(1498)-N(3))-methyltransferase [Candidatus Berkiella sp.]